MGYPYRPAGAPGFPGVSDDQILTVPVPVHLKGTPLGVTIDGGILDHAMYEVDVTVRAADIPSELVFDVSEMRMNDRLHLAEMTLPEGMTVDLSTDPVIASIIPPKTLKPFRRGRRAGRCRGSRRREPREHPRPAGNSKNRWNLQNRISA